MELTEFNDKAAQILANLSDQGKVSVLLADLTKGFADEVSANNDTKAENDRLTADNAKLKEDNLTLFTRVSVAPGKKTDTNPGNTIDGLFAGGKLNVEVK